MLELRDFGRTISMIEVLRDEKRQGLTPTGRTGDRSGLPRVAVPMVLVSVVLAPMALIPLVPLLLLAHDCECRRRFSFASNQRLTPEP